MTKKKKNKFKIEKYALVEFLVVFIIATAVFVPIRGTAGEILEQEIFTEEGEKNENILRDMTPIVVDEGSSFYDEFQTQERVNILCLGVNQGMTDTIMLASYDMKNQKIDIVSVPRDTYYYRGKGYWSYASHKINAIYSSEGVVSLAHAVSDVLYGMPIHYYAMVEYDDVKAIMNAIGGVEIDVPFAMKYDDPYDKPPLHIDIPAGLQTIDGSNVMEFLRFRHTNPHYAAQGYKSYSEGDIQRIQVQQEFVQKVLKKCLKVGNLTTVAKVILENIDSDLTYGIAAKIALNALNGLSSENITSYTVPGYADMIQELSFWVPDEEGITNMLEQIYMVKSEAQEITPAAVTR